MAETVETPKSVTRARSPIYAYRETELGAMQQCGGPFTDYTQFKAWVKETAETGTTFVPLRQTGKALTLQKVTKTTLV